MLENGRKFIAYSLSDVGKKRENNEDSFIYKRLDENNGTIAYLMAVADGMGGQLGGEVASNSVVQVLDEHVNSSSIYFRNNNFLELLKNAITEANNSIYQ